MLPWLHCNCINKTARSATGAAPIERVKHGSHMDRRRPGRVPGPGACSDPAAGWQWQAQRHGHVGAAGEPARGAPRAGHVGQAEYTFPCSGPRNLCSEADMIHRNPLRRSYSHWAELFNAARVVHARICFLRSRGNRAWFRHPCSCLGVAGSSLMVMAAPRSPLTRSHPAACSFLVPASQTRCWTWELDRRGRSVAVSGICLRG